MIHWRAWLPRIHAVLGRSPRAVRLAIKMRNQCTCIMAASVGEGTAPDSNSEAWLIRQVAPRSSVFVDVGANVGDWSALFLEHMPAGGRGVLYEPASWAQPMLVARFGEAKQLEIVGAACGDSSGTLRFYEQEAGETMSSFSADIAHGGEERVVRVTTLDTEATRLGLDHIDLLKIDAEGYDLHVLRGAERLLKEQRIDVIQFEYGEAWPYAGSTLSAAYQLLEGAGYQVFALKGEQLVKVDYQLYGEYFRYTNFVAARPAIAIGLMSGR